MKIRERKKKQGTMKLKKKRKEKNNVLLTVALCVKVCLM
jgi:hypothetical protein